MKRSTGIAVITALSLLSGCASRNVEQGSVAVADRGIAPQKDSTVAVAPVVQIREYPGSALVTIMAWDPEEADLGLRAQIRRDGSLVRDHRLYVSTIYFGGQVINVNRLRTRGAISTVVPEGEVLEPVGGANDADPCNRGDECAPPQTIGARIPDTMLRANRDSVAVRFYRSGTDLVVAVRRGVIDPYLHAVDSVTAALRAK